MAPRVVDQPVSSRPLPDSFASVIENLKEQREKIREQLPDMKFQIPTNFRDIGKIPSLSELAQAVPQLNPDRFKNITQVISTVMNMNSTGSQQRPPNPIELFREVAKNVTSNTSGRFNSTNISNMLENSSIMNMTRPFFNMSGNTNFTDFFPPSMNMSNMFNGTMMNLTRPFQQMFNTSSGNMSTFPMVNWVEHYNGSMPVFMMNQSWLNGTYPNLTDFLPPFMNLTNMFNGSNFQFPVNHTWPIVNMLENSSIMNMTRPFFNVSGNTNFTDFLPPFMNVNHTWPIVGTMMNLTRPFQQMFNTSSGNMSTFPIVDWVEHYNGSMPVFMMNQSWLNGTYPNFTDFLPPFTNLTNMFNGSNFQFPVNHTWPIVNMLENSSIMNMTRPFFNVSGNTTYPNLPNFTLPPVSDMGNWSRPNINMTNAETAIENAINQVNSITPTNFDMQNTFDQTENILQNLIESVSTLESNVQNVFSQAGNSNTGSSEHLQNGGLFQFLLG